MHHACYRGAWRAAATLVVLGAATDGLNGHGETPEGAAKAGGHPGLGAAVAGGADELVVGRGVPFSRYASTACLGIEARDVSRRNRRFRARRPGARLAARALFPGRRRGDPRERDGDGSAASAPPSHGAAYDVVVETTTS